MNRRAFLLLLLLPALLLVLRAPWPRGQEIDRYQSADVLALDQTGPVLQLTLSIRGDQEAEAAVLSGQGETLEQALSDLSQAAQRQPLYAQTRFLLVGESFSPQEAAVLCRQLLDAMDLRLNTALYSVSGPAAPLISQDLGNTLEESRLRLAASGETVSTIGSLLRQFSQGQSPGLTVLHPQG